jgi:CRP-like cAMP-binding protein
MTSQQENKLKLTKTVKILGYYIIYIWHKINEAKLEREIFLGNLNYNDILINEASKPIEKTKKNYFKEKIQNADKSKNYRNSNLIYLTLLKFNGLKRYMLFQEINNEDIREISKFIKHEFYPKGSYIFRQNQPSNKLYGIIKGKAEIKLVNSKELTKNFYTDMIKGENLEEFQQNNGRDKIPFEYFLSDCEIGDDIKKEEKEISSDEEEDKKKYVKIIDIQREKYTKQKKEKFGSPNKRAFSSKRNVLFKEDENKPLNIHRSSIVVAENELKRREIEDKKRLQTLQKLNEEQIDDMLENRIFSQKKLLIRKNINKIEKIHKFFLKRKSKTIKFISAIKKFQTPDNLFDNHVLENFLSEFEINRISITEGMCFGEWGLVYNIPRTTSVYCVEDTHVFCLEKKYFDKYLLKKFYAGDIKKIKFIYDRLPALRKSFENRKNTSLFFHILTKIVPKFYDEGDIVYTPYDRANIVYLVYKGECLLTKLKIKTKDKLDYLNKKDRLVLVATLGEGAVCGLESIEKNKNYEYCLTVKQNFTILLKLEFDYFTEENDSIKDALRPLYELQSRILNKLKYKAELFKKEYNLNAQIRKIKQKNFLNELNSNKEIKNSKNDKQLGELNISINNNNFNEIKNKLPKINYNIKSKNKRKNIRKEMISKRFSILSENMSNIIEKKNNIFNNNIIDTNKSKHNFFLTDTTLNQNLETEQSLFINKTLPNFSGSINENSKFNTIKKNSKHIKIKSEIFSEENRQSNQKKSKIDLLKHEIGADSYILDSVYNFKRKKNYSQFDSGMFDIQFLSQINLKI